MPSRAVILTGFAHLLRLSFFVSLGWPYWKNGARITINPDELSQYNFPANFFVSPPSSADFKKIISDQIITWRHPRITPVESL